MHKQLTPLIFILLAGLPAHTWAAEDQGPHYENKTHIRKSKKSKKDDEKKGIKKIAIPVAATALLIAAGCYANSHGCFDQAKKPPTGTGSSDSLSNDSSTHQPDTRKAEEKSNGEEDDATTFYAGKYFIPDDNEQSAYTITIKKWNPKDEELLGTFMTANSFFNKNQQLFELLGHYKKQTFFLFKGYIESQYKGPGILHADRTSSCFTIPSFEYKKLESFKGMSLENSLQLSLCKMKPSWSSPSHIPVISNEIFKYNINRLKKFITKNNTGEDNTPLIDALGNDTSFESIVDENGLTSDKKLQAKFKSLGAIKNNPKLFAYLAIAVARKDLLTRSIQFYDRNQPLIELLRPDLVIPPAAITAS